MSEKLEVVLDVVVNERPLDSSRKLKTVLDVVISEQQVNEAIRVQINNTTNPRDVVDLNEIAFAVTSIVDLYKNKMIVVGGDGNMLVNKHVTYVTESKLNVLVGIITNNMHKIKMPENWA